MAGGMKGRRRGNANDNDGNKTGAAAAPESKVGYHEIYFHGCQLWIHPFCCLSGYVRTSKATARPAQRISLGIGIYGAPTILPPTQTQRKYPPQVRTYLDAVCDEASDELAQLNES